MMLVALMGMALAGAGELPEWTFDAGAEGWIPNGHLANVFLRDGKMRAEAVDWDPFLTCSGLAIEAKPWQYVVINIRSDRTGTGELFWTGETGGEHGARWLVEQGLLRGDACLMAEPSTIHASVVAEKGICWLKVRAPGRPAHGSLPMLGENAIEKAARAMEVLKGLEDLEVQVPEELAAVVESSRELFKSLAPSLAQELGLPPAKAEGITRALDHITVNFGIIRGGTKVNVVPEACELDVDVRVPPGFKPEEVLAWVRSRLAEAGLGDVSCEVVHSSEPNYTPPSSRIFGLLKANAKEIAGLDIRPIIITGGTDARFLRWRGVPTIHYGPGVLHKAHAYDEFVEVRDLKVATLVLAGTMLDFIFGWQAQP